MKKYLALIIISLFTFTVAFGQNASRLKNQSWVRIMQNDTSINFFKAQKDYSKFRLVHEKEETRRESARKKQELNNSDRLPNETHLEDPEESMMKAYEKWAMSMKPFVNSDGYIMPIEKRLDLIRMNTKEPEMKKN